MTTNTSSIAHHQPADPVRDHHEDEHHDDHGPEKGWRRWVFATNHKDIGTMYLLFSLLMFFVGGTMAMVIRAELFKPCLLYTSDAADERSSVDLGGRRI